MKSSNPLSYCANRRALTACVLAFAILITPFAQLAAATSRQRSGVRDQRSENKDQRADDQAKNVATDNLFVNPLTAVPAPPLPGPQPEPAPQPLAPTVGSVTATMTATIANDDGDTKIDPTNGNPGTTERIDYTATLGNTTGSNANGLSFNDILDSHTAFVGGSIQSTPVAFDISGVAATTNEDTSKVITLQGQDPDGTNLTFTNLSVPGHGTLGSVGSVSCTNGVC